MASLYDCRLRLAGYVAIDRMVGAVWLIAG
jgi:hypothetical protein